MVMARLAVLLSGTAGAAMYLDAIFDAMAAWLCRAGSARTEGSALLARKGPHKKTGRPKAACRGVARLR
jgi:hypothetical protein